MATARRLVTMAAVADEFSISVRTVRRWVAEGRVPGYRVGPRSVRLDLDEVAAYVRPIPSATTTGRGSRK